MKRTFGIFTSLSLLAWGGWGGVHRVSLQALDAETGRPLPGLAAGAAFKNARPFSLSPSWMHRTGTTDEEGRFAAVGLTTRGRIRFGIDPSVEYYGWREELDVNALEPFVSRTCPLRRHHPARLVGISVDCRIGLMTDGPVSVRYGFDFLCRSFLPPYGTGTVADIEMSLIDSGGPSSSMRGVDSVCTLSFPGAGNGGVLRKIPSDTDFVLDRVDESEMTNVFDRADCRGCRLGFRIRSRFDDDGRLVDAHYGYIRDASSLLHLLRSDKASSRKGDSVWIGFDACLNPTPGENNLESFGRPESRHFVSVSFPVLRKEDE